MPVRHIVLYGSLRRGEPNHRRLGLDRSTAGLVVGKLVEAGLIARATDAEDQRRYRLRITRRGRERLAALEGPVAEERARLLAPFTAEEAKQFLALLHRFVDARDVVGGNAERDVDLLAGDTTTGRSAVGAVEGDTRRRIAVAAHLRADALRGLATADRRGHTAGSGRRRTWLAVPTRNHRTR